MSEIEKIATEGNSIADAVNKAAETLGVSASLVKHSIDRDHFRTASGTMRAVETVRIFAWALDAAESEGADAAAKWLGGLLENMGIEAKVTVALGDSKHATLKVDTEQAGRVVGRRGSTLNAIQALLVASLEEDYGEWKFRIDVLDARDEGRDRDGGRDRDRRDTRGRDRDDRGRGRDRDDRGRGRDRDDRGRGRDRDDRGRGRDDRGPRQRSDRDVAKLQELARRLAKNARKSGEEITIRRDLNSYERRLVHVEIAEIEGVRTESVMDGDLKRVVIIPDAAGGGEE